VHCAYAVLVDNFMRCWWYECGGRNEKTSDHILQKLYYVSTGRGRYPKKQLSEVRTAHKMCEVLNQCGSSLYKRKSCI
jgi:hypothetical protein